MNPRTTHKLLLIGATALVGIAAATAVALGATPANHAASAETRERQNLANSLTKLVAAGAPGAIILVRHGGRTTLVARGLADTRRKRPMRQGDTFRIGSLTKTYVATVVLQLAEEGRLSLDDPVARFLPGLVPGGEKISIRQLLNHTSGLYDALEDPRVLKPYLAGNLAYHWAPRKLVRIAVSHRPLFPPGTRYSYSGTNYLVAGLIVEALTGWTLGRELERRIFTPLRLHHSAFQTSPRRHVPDAHGYYVFDKPPATDITGLSPYAWAAGAIVANAADVATFYRGLLSGRLLQPGSLRAMKTTVSEGTFPTDIRGSRYGLGLERSPTPCGSVWGHGGNFPGYEVYALSSPNGKRQVFLAMNEEPHSLPKRANSLFMQLLVGAYCGRSHS